MFTLFRSEFTINTALRTIREKTDYSRACSEYHTARKKHPLLASYFTIQDLPILWHVALISKELHCYDISIECFERILALSSTDTQHFSLDEVRRQCALTHFSKETYLLYNTSLSKFFSTSRTKGNAYLAALSHNQLQFIHHGELIVRQQLGKGAFGYVYLGALKKSRTQSVAIKYFTAQTEDDEYAQDDEESWAAFVHEMLVLSELLHPNIIELFAVCTSPKKRSIIIEYMNMGSLSEYIKTNKQPLNCAQKQLIETSITEAIVYMHQKNLVHQDIKSSNVLLHQDDGVLSAKLADFGFTHTINKTTQSCTLFWMAPELKHGARASKETDIYALGLLLWVIASYQRLTKSILQQIEEENFANIFEDLSPEFCMLLAKCWRKNPVERPVAMEVQELLYQDHLIDPTLHLMTINNKFMPIQQHNTHNHTRRLHLND